MKTIAYKYVKEGQEFTFNGQTFVKLNWLGALLKGEKKYKTMNPSCLVKVA